MRSIKAIQEDITYYEKELKLVKMTHEKNTDTESWMYEDILAELKQELFEMEQVLDKYNLL